MNMSVFKKVEETAAEYNICWGEAISANKAAKEIIKAVTDRIRAEKQRDDSRVSELTARSRDTSKSETIRRVALIEIKEIKSRNYGITEAEQRELYAEIERGKKAVADGIKLISAIRDAIWNATDELNKVKADTHGNSAKDFALSAKWFEGIEQEAAKL